MMKYAKLGEAFWVEVVKIVIYLLNREPTKALEGMELE